MTDKYLEGKGAVTYDYKHDMLVFRTKGRRYSHSVDFSNFIIDVDEDDFIVGIRVMDASGVMGVPKYALRRIQHVKFNAEKNDERIMIQLQTIVQIRNKKQEIETPASAMLQEVAPYDMPNSRVQASMTV